MGRVQGNPQEIQLQEFSVHCTLLQTVVYRETGISSSTYKARSCVAHLWTFLLPKLNLLKFRGAGWGEGHRLMNWISHVCQGTSQAHWIGTQNLPLL